jgi:Kef-type K+ transport system membrane component KefB
VSPRKVPDYLILLELAGILVAARFGAELADRLGAPRVIGELCAGVLLGPSVLGLIEPNDVIRLLAEIGIILLLFEVGFETDLGRLARAGGKSAGLALVGFLAPFLLGFVLCRYVFELSLLVSLFVGGTLTATSIGVTVRILDEIGQGSSQEGQIVLGAAVIDDVLGVVLLAVLYEFALTGAVGIINAGQVLAFVGGFFVLAPLIAKLLSIGIYRMHAGRNSSGVIPTALVALVLAFAALAHVFGAPELLGGFAAGIALSRRFFLPLGISMRVGAEFDHDVRAQMRPIIQLFTPVFFVMVGLSLDLSAVDWSSAFIWAFSLALVLVAIAGKLAGGLIVNEKLHSRVAIGMAMVPRGEVGLIFAELGRTSGVFDAEVYAGIILVIAYTTLLSPFWIRLYYRRYAARFNGPESSVSLPESG